MKKSKITRCKENGDIMNLYSLVAGSKVPMKIMKRATLSTEKVGVLLEKTPFLAHFSLTMGAKMYCFLLKKVQKCALP